MPSRHEVTRPTADKALLACQCIRISQSSHFSWVHRVNDSKFGLQAGVFTHDMDKAFYAFENLEVALPVLSMSCDHNHLGPTTENL